MISKTVNDIRTEILNGILDKLPSIDMTEGTPERDLFVEAPIAGQLIPLWDKVVYTSKLFAPILYYEDLEKSDVEKYMANYNVTLKGKTNSTGIVTFFTKSFPSQDIVIPSGTVVKTDSSEPIEFVVTGTYTIYVSIASSYYNSVTEQWEINCNVEAVNPGPEYRAGSGTVIVLSSNVSGIDGCTNSNPVSGGESAESIDSGLRRVITKFQGRGLGATQGIQTYVSGFSHDLSIVGAEDSDMERDLGRGKCVDIHINGEDLEDASDTYVITSTGLNNLETVTYTTDSITLNNQPVNEILSVSLNSSILSLDDYELILDTGLHRKSTSSVDKIQLTSTGLTNNGYFEDGDVIEINYLYNALLHTIKNSLNSTENHYMNRDYLVREMTEVSITTSFRFKEATGQDFNTVSDTVELAISSFINELGSNTNVELADIIGVAKAISSVDNIDIDTVEIVNTGGGTLTAQGDILLGKNEFPFSLDIVLTRWET